MGMAINMMGNKMSIKQGTLCDKGITLRFQAQIANEARHGIWGSRKVGEFLHPLPH